MRTFLIAWMVAWPTITVLIGVLEDVIGDWPLPLRTLLLTGLMVLSMQTLFLPVAYQLLAALRSAKPQEKLERF
ncbi:MAG: hypothetical protein AAFO68_06465 [Pseudomonadota bacterium]